MIKIKDRSLTPGNVLKHSDIWIAFLSHHKHKLQTSKMVQFCLGQSILLSVIIINNVTVAAAFQLCFTRQHFRDRRRSGPIVTSALILTFFAFNPWELYTQGY